MNDRQRNLNEYNDISQALSAWFESQGVPPAKAVATMSYLTGCMAAAGCANDVAKAMSLLDTCDSAARAIAVSAILMDEG